MRGKAGLFSRNPPPFTPTSLPGLTAWWDASDSATLFDADTGGAASAADGEVGRIEDKSGNGRHFKQATSENRPARKTSQQNGNDVVRFDGTNDKMTSDFALLDVVGQSESSVFIVAKAASVTTNANDANIFINQAIVADVTAGHQFVTLKANNTAGAYGYDTAFRIVSSSYAPGAWAVFTTTHSSSQLTFSVNAGSASSTSLGNKNFADQAIKLGANWDDTAFFDGDVGEIITYNVALSTSDREAVENYLIDKWGLT